ncbi:MAG TPA: DUF4157 domain-containing protein [Chloroflexota bacterium]|nr:DUF4157 domain-containing protein [Chloroflexota bacterium]
MSLAAMQLQTPQQKAATPAPAGGVLQRQCACGNHTMTGGECAECRKKRLQRKATNQNQQETVLPIVNEVLRSPGQPLDPTTRAYMEPRFGHDFSSVRVHTDTKAAESAWAVDALAYTVGRSVVFGAGQYAPKTHAGGHLLAHELTHVVQQGVRCAGNLQYEKAISDPSDAAEVEADNSAKQIMSGRRVAVTQQPSATVHTLSNEAASGLGIGAGILGGIGLGLGIAALAGAFDKEHFSEAELTAYLTLLRTKKRIEDNRDSDNKARDVVAKGLFKGEDLPVRILLIEEMLSGVTGDDDEDAIVVILNEASPKERTTIADRIGIERLYDKIDGKQLDSLYALFPELNSLHPRGSQERNTLSVEAYIDKWEKEHGHSMTEEEKKTLGRGCVGVTALNMEDLGNPDLTNCYDTFAQVWEAAKTMNAFLEANRPDRKAIIFSKRFWSGGKEFKPDPKTGKVDLSAHDDAPRPNFDSYEFINFDYGLYDEKTGKWWHANHCDWPLSGDPDCGPPAFSDRMEAYESNLQSYSKPMLDFDRQVFCVAVGVRH